MRSKHRDLKEEVAKNASDAFQERNTGAYADEITSDFTIFSEIDAGKRA